MNKNDPAFPWTKTELTPSERQQGMKQHVVEYGGLTKREWFAGMAMQGFLSDSKCDLDYDAIVMWSWRYADMMGGEWE